LKKELKKSNLPESLRFYGSPDFIVISMLRKRDRMRLVESKLKKKQVELNMENSLREKFKIFSGEILLLQTLYRSLNSK